MPEPGEPPRQQLAGSTDSTPDVDEHLLISFGKTAANQMNVSAGTKLPGVARELAYVCFQKK